MTAFTLIIAFQLLSAGSALSPIEPFLLAKPDFSLVEQHQGRWSNMSIAFDDPLDERHLFSRQSQGCEDPGYGNISTYPAQTSINAVPLATHANKVAVAVTAKFNARVARATIQKRKSAAKTVFLVRKVATACPGAVVQQASNRAGHLTATIRKRSNAARTPRADVTKISPAAAKTAVQSTRNATTPDGEEEAPEFTCVPVTATDAVGDTLELGDDCGLTLQLAIFNSTNSSSSTTATPTPRMKPRAPQASPADDTCLYTSTNIVTYTKNTITTTTTTVTREEPTQSFSCPPMSVTNGVGDELSLDEECGYKGMLAGAERPTESLTAMSGSKLLERVSHSFHFRDHHKQAGNVMVAPLYEFSLSVDESSYVATIEDVRRMLEDTFQTTYRTEDIQAVVQKARDREKGSEEGGQDEFWGVGEQGLSACFEARVGTLMHGQ
ncbi:uncharacterized protein KY384_004805 [Bacidia gigantensis]|uniref:uncharacterized protein n=1 Tax=Bacidia gigantensis TaxID=2732470 RepID=UPI001D03A731|nr:uncharacterized protein KY384_004805 [Bacidia gigantensis]KAG8530303.1 hypothetical protein KY384_004805 [Bacidia gigantensis]